MLSELTLEYEDGTKVVKVVPKSESTIYPQRDNIRHCSHRSIQIRGIKTPLFMCCYCKNGRGI
jgi:hypothetical protein